MKGFVASAILSGCKGTCGDKASCKAWGVVLDRLIAPGCDGQGWWGKFVTFNHVSRFVYETCYKIRLLLSFC